MTFSILKIQRFTLYVFFLSLNFEMFNLFGLGSTSRITGLIYLFSILPTYSNFIRTKHIKSFLLPPFLLWLLMTIVSLINLSTRSDSFIDTTILLNILLFWFLINHERIDPGIIDKGLFVFSISAILLTFLYNLGIGIEYEGGRISIFGDNQNGMGIRLSIAIIILVYITLTNSFSLSNWRFLLLLPIPVMINFMFETGSRNAFVGLVTAFIIGIALYRTNRWHKVLLYLSALVVTLIFIQYLKQSEVLYYRLLQTAEEGSLGGREDIWSSIIPLIRENILWGVGQTGYQEYIYNIYRVQKSPHNVIFEVMAYTGIIGLSLYLYFVLRTNLQGIKIYQRKGFLLPILLLIPTWGMILGGHALVIKIYWAIYALAISTILNTERKIHESTLHD